MRLGVEVLVAPKHWKTGAVGKACVLAHGVVAFVVCELHQPVDHFRHHAVGVQPPLRIEERGERGDDRQGDKALDALYPRNVWVQRDGVADDGLHLRH